MLRKSNKKDYIVIKVYRSITLFNIINKLLKLIMSHKFSLLIKTNHILLKTQINVRKNKLIESVLQLLTKQVHII